MNLENDPQKLEKGAPQGSRGFISFICGLNTHCFEIEHCHLLPENSDGTCFCDSTGDLGGQKKVPNEARGQMIDSKGDHVYG